MKTALEQVGERILRRLLPTAEASACGQEEEWYAYSSSDGRIAFYDAVITCTSEQGCHVYGPSLGIDYTTWNGFC